MRVLVTGGCGYIGSATARMLRDAGHEVTVVDNLSEGHRSAWDGDFVPLELLDEAAVRRLLKHRSFDGLIHFAARAYVGESVHQPLRYWRANVVPLLNLLDNLPGVPVVFSSTCAVYGLPQGEVLKEDQPLAPVNPYGATKAAAERLLADRNHANQGSYAALRYFNASGAEPDGSHGEHHRCETHLIPLAIQAALGQGEPLTVFGTDWGTPDGTCVRDYIHVQDLASAHLAALQRLLSGQASGHWNLGTGSGSSVQQIIQAVEQTLGEKVPWKPGPRRSGDPPYLVADPTRAQVELGWEARWRDLPTLVETAVKWHRSHPQGYSD